MDFEVRKNELENKYKNHEPIVFHLVADDGAEDDILLSFNDVNYERAYYQQKSLLELEEAHYNKQPLKNIGNLADKDVVDFSDDKYEDIYNKRKKVLLNLKANNIIKKVSDELQEKNEGKHFKEEKQNVESKKIEGKKVRDLREQKELKVDESSKYTYIGGKHFLPNNLNSEYAVFKKDGYLHIVGNFTGDWVKDNYNQIVGDMSNDKNIPSIKLWNRLENGDTPLDGFDVKVRVNNDGSIKIIGNVDKIEYHNQSLDNDYVPRKVGKHFKEFESNDTPSLDDVPIEKDDSGLDIIPPMENEDKDMLGLDIIPDNSTFDDLKTGAEEVKPAKGRKITRKEAKPSLIKRGIEKFKGLKKWQKVAIVAGVIAVVGVGVFVVGPHIIDGINNLLNPENVNTASQVAHATSTVNETATQAVQSIDYSSIGGAGHTVFGNASDAANNVNGVISNQWFSNNPVDVFNTATNSYMGLTPEQLNDPNLLAELAKDPNNAMLFGNSINDPSGFIGLDDVVKTVTKIR